jgi:transposase InsO family protein
MDAPAEEVEEPPEEDGIISEDAKPEDGGHLINNRGTLILDATCFPQDIHYPTDIGLLNHARELAEDIIDKLYKAVQQDYAEKPRTYRQVAHKDFLAYAKTRKHSAKTLRKHTRKQLQYLERDMRIIDDLTGKGAPLPALGHTLYRKLLVIAEAARQQREMYDNKTHQCPARIVSIAQPHLRPIVRGKEHAPVEFGSKVAIGLVGGYAFITGISWDNIPEASLLPDAAEQYKRLFGFYPASITGDGVYPNRDNRQWCKERGIRISGRRLGRKNEILKNEERKRQYLDGCERNAVEAKFGLTKRKFGLGRIMAKLPNTSKTVIAMGFFAANMERKLRLLFAPDSFCFVLYDFDSYELVLTEIL